MNFTTYHYASKMLSYIIQAYVQRQWEIFLSKPADEQTWERFAILISMWFIPLRTKLQTELSSDLDRVARHIMTELREINPSHPIFNVTEDVMKEWQAKKIDDNQFNAAESKEIILLIRKFMRKRFDEYSCRFFFYEVLK